MFTFCYSVTFVLLFVSSCISTRLSVTILLFLELSLEVFFRAGEHSVHLELPLVFSFPYRPSGDRWNFCLPKSLCFFSNFARYFWCVKNSRALQLSSLKLWGKKTSQPHRLWKMSLAFLVGVCCLDLLSAGGFGRCGS